jgi:hypothetical protein
MTCTGQSGRVRGKTDQHYSEGNQILISGRGAGSSRFCQQPLQMLLTFLSTLESCASSARMTSSPCIAGPCVTVPSMRLPTAPPAESRAVPTVVDPIGAPPPAAAPDPEELAVPNEFVPGVLADLAALPAPLGSLPELLRPAAFPGPVTPFTAVAPEPAEPALGALPVAPVPAPPADAPPADAPPADPPPLPPPPPPPLCAIADTGSNRVATTSNLYGKEWGIGNFSFPRQRRRKRRVPMSE